MFGTRLSRLGSVSRLGLVPKAIAILRSYGADAHVYLPGVGTLNGITAGNYLDSSGTTAASVDNPVGLSLDALQAMTLGSELVTNGTNPTVTTSWSATGVSVAAVSSEFQVTRVGGGAGWVSQAISVTVGKTYVLTATARKGTSNLAYLRVSSGANGVSPWGADAYTSSAINAPLTLTFVPAATTVYVNLGGQDLDGAVFYNNISVREIPGIHATQGTTANKPILRRGLFNLLTYSNDLANAAWVKTGTSTAPTASTVNVPSVNDYLYQVLSPAASYAAKQITVAYELSGAGTLAIGTYDNVSFFQTDIVTLADTPSIYTKTITIGTGATDVRAVLGHLGAATATSFSNASRGVFLGSLTAQQILDAGGIPLTTSAAASNPSAGKYSWQLDGTDSLMSAPLFQMSDDHCVIAGANCTSVAFDATIADVAGHNTGQVTAAISYTATNGFIKATWSDNTLVPIVISDNVNRVGAATVSTAVKIGNAKRLRVNGVQSGATNNTVMGATTLTGGTIGRNTWNNNFFVGSIYPVIAIKGTLSDSDLLVLERFVGQLSGVSI